MSLPPAVIETPRLWLARFRPDDRAAHRALLDTPVLARLLPVPTPIADELADAVFEQILALPPEQPHLAIWRKVEPALIGSVGVHVDPRDRHGALSIGIAPDGDRGRGLGTEAARALISHAFASLGLRKVWFNHHGDNVAVRTAAERLGFREVGRQRGHCLLEGAWVDWVTMELFAEDWRPEP
ncbi:MAG: GNAT family N-acetyltransferase [Kofleriaceae bacterium]|nr:GNAT family N-acetyltransferase [Kofleriaceae bacterium]MBP9167517.1 GNAT family N-acetyltransferase [Kofleriaceae bacterium]MBP9856598.1 GNAT family N-acetyltransferase [Kofleriaceae bacterium]